MAGPGRRGAWPAAPENRAPGGPGHAVGAPTAGQREEWRALLEPAVRAAREVAADVLLAEFAPERGSRAVTRKADGTLLTPTDLAADQALRVRLAPLGVPVLSEEQSPAERRAVRASASRYWLLDPLDGTSNFVAGLPFFALSLALVDAGRVVAGVTVDPWRDEAFHALRGEGLRRNGAPVTARRAPPADLGDAIGLVDPKRLPPALRQRLFLEACPLHSMRNLGACALEWAWLAAGRADVYLHGGQAGWDSAVGHLLLTSAGGLASDFEGDDVWRPGDDKRSAIAARSPGLFEAWWRVVQGR